MGVTYNSEAGSFASINPANPTVNSVNNALNTLITDYFSAEHEMRGHTIPIIPTTIPYCPNEDIGSDDTISPWNTFDSEHDHIINNEPEDVWRRGGGWRMSSYMYSTHPQASTQKHEFTKVNNRSNITKNQRKKGYLKQPGGASCDQRR